MDDCYYCGDGSIDHVCDDCLSREADVLADYDAAICRSQLRLVTDDDIDDDDKNKS